ncbi:MAG: potassium channel family protein, partial [Acidobacteria bacterium]|nr:potassium channel family protein [Acidobacteriota bacterium]
AVALSSPRRMRRISQAKSRRMLSPQEAVYLSFFTLTTLGLGNVVPSNGPAQGIMVFEALAGQMYLIVLVARLVSLYSSEDSSR